MPHTILLIRHGTPLFPDEEKRYIGHTDLPLAPESVAQAQALGPRLLGTRALFCSPLSRCTAFAAALGLPGVQPQVLPALAEVDLGQWEGLAMAEVARRWPQEYAARGANLAGFAPPGGENFAAVQRRATAALNTMAAHSAPRVAAVTHAGVIRTLLCQLWGLPLQQLFSIDVPYGGCIALHRQGGTFVPEGQAPCG